MDFYIPTAKNSRTDGLITVEFAQFSIIWEPYQDLALRVADLFPLAQEPKNRCCKQWLFLLDWTWLFLMVSDWLFLLDLGWLFQAGSNTAKTVWPIFWPIIGYHPVDKTAFFRILYLQNLGNFEISKTFWNYFAPPFWPMGQILRPLLGYTIMIS